MKHRRNLAVAAVTAAVVTTALVGTTLPDLVADRASEPELVETSGDQSLSDSFVTTTAPQTPSADEIVSAKGSKEARDKLIVDIVGRIDQASERADELESELMRQQSLASARMEQAAAAAEEAERTAVEAETAQAAEAGEAYQDEGTSAADVLLGEDDALAGDATDQQLEDRAEREAVDAEQAQREAEAAAEQAQREADETQAALANVGETAASTTRDVEDLGRNIYDQILALKELEGFEGSVQEFFEMMLGDAAHDSSPYFTSDGEIDYEQLVYRVQQLRSAGTTEVTDEDAEAEEDESPSAEQETAEDSSDDAEGEAASSEESEVNDDAAAFSSLSEEQQELLATGAELEGFEGSAAEYYAVVLQNSAFSRANGSVNWDVLADHLSYLESQDEEDEEPEESPSPTPSETPSPSPSESSTPSPSESETPSPSASPSESETAAPSPSPSAASFDSLNSEQRELLASAAELEGVGEASDYYRVVLENPNFTTSGGSVNWTVLEGHLSYLQAQATEPEESPEESPSPTQSSSSPSASPSPSQSPTPTPSPTQSSSSPAPAPTPTIPSYMELSRELQNLVNEGSQLESGFSGTGGDYYRAALNNPDLTNNDGTISTSRLASHISHLRSQREAEQARQQQEREREQQQEQERQAQQEQERQQQSNNSGSSGGGNSSSGAQPASSGNGSAAQIAMNWARNEASRSGTSYVLGAAGPNAWDCSSFVQAAYRQAGINLGRTTYAQITQGRQVSWGDRQPGDLIFWGDYHVAIYLGDGMIADAGNPRSGVSVRGVFGNPTSVRRVTG